jgi:hypothetical protein
MSRTTDNKNKNNNKDAIAITVTRTQMDMAAAKSDWELVASRLETNPEEASIVHDGAAPTCLH